MTSINKIDDIVQLRPRVSNSNCSEDQMKTYKVTRGLLYDYTRAALWHWCNNGGTL